MHVFVTGATGWVGSAVVHELLAAGHRVTGQARSPDKAAALRGLGAGVVQATLQDLDTLRDAAAAADAVVHTAFDHDFAHFIAHCAQDQRVIQALGDALRGTRRPLLVTSGLLGVRRGGNETDLPDPASPRRSEPAARALADAGICAATVRLPPSVHGLGEHGFVPILIELARRTGVSAYLDEGQNCWSGVHRHDAARVYRYALEQGAGVPVYHAIAGEAVPFKQIAEVIGKHLKLPVASRGAEHFGWFARMAGADMAASSAATRALLGWAPVGPELIADLDQPGYYAR